MFWPKKTPFDFVVFLAPELIEPWDQWETHLQSTPEKCIFAPGYIFIFFEKDTFTRSNPVFCPMMIQTEGDSLKKKHAMPLMVLMVINGICHDKELQI